MNDSDHAPGPAKPLTNVSTTSTWATNTSTNTWVELTIRLGALALLLYFSFTLVQPFITIGLWSVILVVALNPAYERLARLFGGRPRLAAFVITLFSLLVVIGPATWLALGLVDSLRMLAGQLDPATLTVPQPPESVKGWPLIGQPIYEFWNLASSNLREALGKIVPQLKPLGSVLLRTAADAGTGALKFFVALFITGFLFTSGPALTNAVRMFARRLASHRGERFVELAGATIRAVSRGVIGISALQAFLVGVGLAAAGVPGASLITSAVLILGIIQIGPSIVLIPLVIWSWTAMETTAAAMFTVYMIPVNLLDNILRPLVMARGLNTPMLIILIGVLGGTISYGITGLFLGPIVLAVIWELTLVWVREHEGADPPAAPQSSMTTPD